MATTTYRISNLQVYMMLITSVGFMNHVLIIPVLFSATVRDAWISACFAFVLMAILVPVMSYIMNGTEATCLSLWLNKKIGVTITRCLYTPVLIYFVHLLLKIHLIG